MWYIRNVLSLVLCTFPGNIFGGIAPLHPKCYPVTAPLCSDTLEIISLDVSSSAAYAETSKLTFGHRKSKRKRKIDEFDVLPWRYNVTTYPTFAGDKSESDSITSLSSLHPLVSTKCSKYIKLFLCSVHSPVCTGKGVVPPCHELCEVVKADCKQIVDMFNIKWPEQLDCNLFPSFKQEERLENSPDYLINEDNTILISRQSPILWTEALLRDKNGIVCIPPSLDDVVLPALLRLKEDENTEKQNKTPPVYLDFGISCPADMRTPSGHHGYTFMGLPNCTAPCPNMYLDGNQLSGVRYFILILAVICVIVTSFTLLTFAIDTKRFRYPERPIVFYALSYLVISIVYLIGFGLREKVACNDKIINENNEIVQGFAVVEGANHRLCSAFFLILYYFTVSGTIWWLILTITWLLAAGFSWGSEAIEKQRLYYHAVAWGLPAAQTLIVCISNKIEGDNIAGVCFVGLYDTQALRFLLLLPMSTYLLIGIGNLSTGFIYLNRVRKKLDGDAKNKEKLAKFMLRIGVFSVLYILPQVVLIVIYAVEDSNRKHWEATWYTESCADYSVPCPASNHTVQVLAADPQHPGIFLFCIKYMMTLIVAVPPLFWVASRKTLRSWRDFFSGKRSLSKHQLGTTQTRLLNDSNGPHARDLQAKLDKKTDDADPVFGKMRNTDLCGSSASVAAQRVTKRPLSEVRQQQWEDLTDSDTTEYGTSVITDSELSRVIAFESLKNRGMRVTGRKGRIPDAGVKKKIDMNKRSEGPVNTERASSSALVHNGHKTNPHLYSEKDTMLAKGEASFAKHEVSAKHTNIKSSMNGQDDKGESRSNIKQDFDTTVNKQEQLKNLESRGAPEKHSQTSNYANQPLANKNLQKIHPPSNKINVPPSGDSIGKEGIQKPNIPPPPPPPPTRVDSMVVLKNLSPERALSL